MFYIFLFMLKILEFEVKYSYIEDSLYELQVNKMCRTMKLKTFTITLDSKEKETGVNVLSNFLTWFNESK